VLKRSIAGTGCCSKADRTVGHAVTYCDTSPSLCILEKLVRIEYPALVPKLVMVTYEVPAAVGVDVFSLADLPSDWWPQETRTQQKDDDRHRLLTASPQGQW
jgi:hypothetical protein